MPKAFSAQTTRAGDPRVLTGAQVRALKQLCHPDRHAQSDLAKKMSQFLNEYVPREDDQPTRRT